MGTQPKCVQTPVDSRRQQSLPMTPARALLLRIPSITSHSGCLTRSSSAWGSLNDDTLTLFACSISSAVRCRMKTGLPRHLIMTCGRGSGQSGASTWGVCERGRVGVGLRFCPLEWSTSRPRPWPWPTHQQTPTCFSGTLSKERVSLLPHPQAFFPGLLRPAMSSPLGKRDLCSSCSATHP